MTDLHKSFFNLIKNAPFGIFVVDADLKLIEISEGAKTFFSRIESFPGRDFTEISRIVWEADFAADVIRYFRQTLAEGKSYYFYQNAECGENTDIYDWKIERCVLPDKNFGVVCYFHELTSNRNKPPIDLNKGILNSLDARIVVLDVNGIIIAINANWKNFARENSADPEKTLSKINVGANYLEVCRRATGEFSAEAETAYQGILSVLERKTNYFAMDYPCHSPTEKHWFHLTCMPLNAVFGGAVISHIDITEQKEAEANLREANPRFRVTFEQAAVGIAHVSLDGKWLLVNETLCKITGYTKDELYSLTFQDITHPEDQPKSAELAKTIFAGKVNTYSIEKRYLRKDKTITWINLTVSIARDEAGNPKYFISVIEDINQRKNTEFELRQWAEAFEHCAHGIGIGDAKTNNIIAVNTAFAKICGLMKSEIEGKPILSIYDSSVQEMIKELIVYADQKESIRYESMMAHSGGTPFPTQVDVVILRDETGKPYRRIATMQDISERKKAENDLRESEGKLRLFIENVPVSVAMFDREMNYLAVSRRWLQEFILEEHGNVIGKNHYEIFKNMPEYWIAVHQRALAGAIEKAEEDKFIQPDGSFIWLKWEVRPWRNAEGEIGGIIIFSENISERKRRAEYLKFLVNISDHLNYLTTISEIVNYSGKRSANISVLPSVLSSRFIKKETKP